jgi:hypothetical protein
MGILHLVRTLGHLTTKTAVPLSTISDFASDGLTTCSCRYTKYVWKFGVFFVYSSDHFMIHQDLRVYTIWRAEISHFKTQHMSYRKTGTEVG